MKIIFLSDMTTKEKAFSYIPELENCNVKFFKLKDADKVKSEKDTDILIIDAMGKADKNLILSLPKLRLIQSEGVGYQGIDTNIAKSNGIAVCNNKGINDTAVAEHTIMLILSCLKGLNHHQYDDYNGTQLIAKSKAFGKIKELSECTVGLIGFGDIAKKTAKMLAPFGCNIIYSNRTRYKDIENQYNVSYSTIDNLLNESDFVSLHLSVNDDTKEIADKSFFSKMKKSAILINTSRGELVDNNALYNAIKNGEISGAGLDVIAPEPVSTKNILLSDDIKDKMIVTPHIAGITSLTVKKMYRNIWNNIENIINNKEPDNKV